MKILIFSDVHLDHYTCGQSRFDDIWLAVKIVCRYAEYDMFMFLGDWADPDNSRSLRASEHAVKLAKEFKNIPSVWLTGNHDVSEDGFGTHVLSALQASGLASVVDKPMLLKRPNWNFQLIGLPYTARVNAYNPGEFIEQISDSLNPKLQTIVIGHLDIEGITPGSEVHEMPRGREVFWPCADIARFIPNAKCFAGHIHTRQTYTRDGCTIQVVGSLSRLTFGEENNTPGYHVLET